MTVLEFKDYLMDFIAKTDKDSKMYTMTDEDIANIEKLVEEKYSTWEWNYGNSPKFALSNELKYPGGNIEFNLEVEKGIITKIKFFGDFFGKNDISTLEILICGTKHEENSLREVLSHINIDDYLLGADIEILISGILGAK